MKNGQNAGCPGAPVAPSDDSPLDAERIEKLQCIHGKGSLLAVSERCVRQEARRAIAAQIGHENAIALPSKIKRRISIGVDIVRPAVDEEHRQAPGRPDLGVSDIKQAGADMLQRSKARGRRRGRSPRCGEHHRGCRPGECLFHEVASIGVPKSGHCMVSRAYLSE